MQLERKYPRVLFTADDLRAGISVFDKALARLAGANKTQSMFLSRDNDTWHFNSEDEFWAEYRRGFQSVRYRIFANATESDGGQDLSISVFDPTGNMYGNTSVSVKLRHRSAILAVFDPLDAIANDRRTPDPPPEPTPPATIFIGHGRSPPWRDLKDHLQDKHGYAVEAYESGERAGHAVRDILESMAANSSFAVLVMTGEDEQPDGTVRARQNVVHEIGLFQGTLGFSRAVVLLEEGTEDFSNISGIHQIRYSKGNIRESFGDVLAALRREFGPSS